MENQSDVNILAHTDHSSDSSVVVGGKGHALTIILAFISVLSLVPFLIWSYFVSIFSVLSFGGLGTGSFLLEFLILIGIASPLIIALACILGLVLGFRKNNRRWFFLPHLVSATLYLLVKLGVIWM